MAPEKRGRRSGPGRRTKAELVAENARLRRALARWERRVAAGGQTAAAGTGPEAGANAAGARQAATPEVLRLIAASPGNPQPVFDAIARHALGLCGAVTALVARYDGSLLHLVAHANVAPDRVDRVLERYPRPLDRTIPMGVALLEQRVVHVRDFQADPQFTGMMATRAGLGSAIAVPLVVHGQAIGAIGLSHPEVDGFPDEVVALLETFADQGVIALENAR